VLSLELQNPIDIVILRSPVVLHLVETDTGTSVLSVTPPSMHGLPGGGDSSSDEAPKFVAVFRCQSQEKRIVLNLRTNEGEHGELQITVVAMAGSTDSSGKQSKAAKTLKYDLRALSLNVKVHALSDEELKRPKNRLTYAGTMSVTVMHEWVQTIFPDVPPRLDEDCSEQSYFFRNSFTGAVTTCNFRKGEIAFTSENASTIAIIKENITRLANYRRLTIAESLNTEAGSVGCFLGLIRSKLQHQLSLSRKMQLVDAIQEIRWVAVEGLIV
jgi:hypothetical protein